MAEHSRLQTAEAHVEPVPLHVRQRQGYAIRVAEGRQPVQHRTAGISESEELRDLVVRLPCRVVAGPAQQPVRIGVGSVPVRDEQVAVAAAHDQRQGREFDVAPRRALLQDDRVDVALDVVDAEQWHVERGGQTLGVGHSHEQRPDQTRTTGDGDCVEVGVLDFRPAERFAHDRYDRAEVLACREFGHDAPVERMNVELRRNDVREEEIAVRDHRGGRLVTGCLDTKQVHGKVERPRSNGIWRGRGGDSAPRLLMSAIPPGRPVAGPQQVCPRTG